MRRWPPPLFTIGTAVLFAAFGLMQVAWSYALFGDWRTSAGVGAVVVALWVWTVWPRRA